MRAEVVGGDPSPAHVAAIVAALAAIQAEEAALAAAASASVTDRLDMWVEASRRSAQRAGLQRGPWRMSGRVLRRSRT